MSHSISRVPRIARIVGVACVAVFALPSVSRAAYTVNIAQVGPNVVASGSGSIDLTALLGQFDHQFVPGFIRPSIGSVAIGTASDSATYYKTVTGPISFGAGGNVLASSVTGNVTAVSYAGSGVNFNLYVPDGYVSKSSLSGSSTFANTTIAGLGITPGTYTYTWGTGPTADSFIMTTVPEPGTLLAAGAALAICCRGRRRGRQVAW